MSTPLKCDENRIRQFLRQQLSDAEQLELQSHLELCDTCCSVLDDATAETPWWNDVRQLLPDQPDDLEPLTEVLATSQPGEAAEGIEEKSESPLVSVEVRQVVNWLAPTDDPQRLGRIGAYEIAGVIGAGGMGVVLKGFDASLNRYVAIKVLAPHLATSGAARKRFAREAQAAAAVLHENVIAIHGVEEFNGLPFLVMPYVKGSSLQRRLDDNGPLELKEVLRIAKQTASGLAAAHAQGLVHRDVKPANILLEDGVERVTITDFGLARAVDDVTLTRTGTIAGTPQYMSPEQARGDGIDHRSDLFSLGSVLYAMCTARAPFRAESSYAVLRRISDALPTPIRQLNSDIPEWLCRLIDKLHAKSPDQRYGSATEVAADLERCLAHIQQPLREPLPSWLEGPSLLEMVWQNYRSWIAAIAGLICVVLIGFFGLPAPESDSQAPSNQASEATEVDSTAESDLLTVEQRLEDEDSAATAWDDHSERLLLDIEVFMGQLERESDWLDADRSSNPRLRQHGAHDGQLPSSEPSNSNN